MIKTAILICVLSRFQAFEYRETSPLSLFPHPIAISDILQPETASNPALLPFLRRTYLCASGGVPYSMEGLASGMLSAGTGGDSLACRIAWSRFGMDHYSENLVEVEGGYRICSFLSLGAGGDYYHLAIDSNGLRFSTKQPDLKIGALLRPADWLFFAFRQDNAVSLFLRHRRDLLFPGWSAGLGLAPMKGVFFAWNTTRTPFGTVNSLSLSANLLKNLSLKAGYARETSTYAAAFQFAYRLLAVSYGVRYHPQLGVTHCAGVTLSPENLELESMNYRTDAASAPSASGPKININSCSFEELRGVPGLDDSFAERIIAYRKLFGPVSRKSLSQIGLEEREIDRLHAYIYGLADSRPEKNRGGRPEKKGPDLELRKRLFLKLTREGLSPSLAFRVSEIAGDRGAKDFMNRVGALAGISEAEKEIVRRVWEGSR